VPIIGPLAAFTRPGGKMILSGFLEQDKEEMNAALGQHKLKNFSIRNDNNWLTYTVAVP
jgi:ribosomal protein L11 methylase PrmA